MKFLNDKKICSPYSQENEEFFIFVASSSDIFATQHILLVPYRFV